MTDTEESTATIVAGANDWQAIYVDGEVVHQNHTVGVEDALNRRDVNIGSVERRSSEMDRIVNRFPETLDDLDRFEEFVDDVEANREDWAERLRDELTERDGGYCYVMSDHADEAFDLDGGEGRILLSLFSKVSALTERTPLDAEPVVELDHEHSETGTGPAAYRLCEE